MQDLPEEAFFGVDNDTGSRFPQASFDFLDIVPN
jgi:hypothetical protein